MSYSYKVVPFIGRSRGSLSASDVAQQLEITINQHASAGWEFVQLTDVNIEVQPGCLGGVLGAKVEYARFDQLIFRSESESRPLRTRTTETDRPMPPWEKSRSIETKEQTEPLPSSQQREAGAGEKAKQSTDRYQPERLANGKIRCVNCGTENDPRQIRCSECDNQLYALPR